MANNANTDRTEKLFDAMLKVAAEEATIQEMDALPSREELEKLHPRSDVFEKRIMKIIGKHESAVRRKRAMQTFYRVAACVAIIFTVGVVTLMSVEASRNFIRNVIFNIRDDHVAFEFWQEQPTPQRGELVVGYLPDGFELVSSGAREGRGSMVFFNNAGQQITIQQDNTDTQARFFQTENMEFSITSVRNHEAYLFESLDGERVNKVMWVDGEYILTVLADVEIDVLMRIAENLKLR